MKTSRHFLQTFTAGLTAALAIAFAPATDANPVSAELANWERTEIPGDELIRWGQWGKGELTTVGNPARVQMVESEDSLGLILVSPQSFETRFAVTYRVMTLRPATVLVLIHSFSDGDGSGALTLPSDYDGGTGILTGRSFYFFAFHNAPHDRFPFVRRGHPTGADTLVEAERSHMRPGIWHDVEIGRIDERVWLKIDGKPVLDTMDRSTLPGGHLVFRIRGTGLERASCQIADVVLHRPSR